MKSSNIKTKSVLVCIYILYFCQEVKSTNSMTTRLFLKTNYAEPAFDPMGQECNKDEENDGCIDIPIDPYHRSHSGINSIITSECIEIFTRKKCGGESIKIFQNMPDLSITGFQSRVYAYRYCTKSKTVPKLSSEVYEINLSDDSLNNNSFDDNIVPYSMSSNAFYNNNSTEMQEYSISATTHFKNEVTFEKTDAISSFDRNIIAASASVSLGIGGIIPKLLGLKALLKASIGFEFEKLTSFSSSSLQRNETKTTDEKKFEFKQTIRVGPCQFSEINFMLNVTNNIPIQYKFLMKITGEKCGKTMSLSELILNLPPGVKYIEKYDEKTIIASVEGILRAKIGFNPHLDIKSRLLSNCPGSGAQDPKINTMSPNEENFGTKVEKIDQKQEQNLVLYLGLVVLIIIAILALLLILKYTTSCVCKKDKYRNIYRGKIDIDNDNESNFT